MGFYLKGIITTDADQEIVRKAKIRWTNIRVKKFGGEVHGIAIVGPDINKADSYQKHDYFQEINYRIENELLDFSLEFPNTKFAFIFVDCWGGYCQYSGFVCKGGKRVIDLSQQIGETANQEKQDYILKILLAEIGIEIGEKVYFEPFTRNFFNEDQHIKQQLTAPMKRQTDASNRENYFLSKIWSWLTGK